MQETGKKIYICAKFPCCQKVSERSNERKLATFLPSQMTVYHLGLMLSLEFYESYSFLQHYLPGITNNPNISGYPAKPATTL